jgi:hypothetical protein
MTAGSAGRVVMAVAALAKIDIGGEFIRPPFFRRGQPHKIKGFEM